jgi:3-oxoacyl-[acyl-carrier-protein] synthase II
MVRPDPIPGRPPFPDSPPGDGAVVVTGIGAVTPFGVGVPALRAGLAAGVSAAGPVTRFDAAGHPARIACEVTGFDAGELLPKRLLGQLDPFAAYAMVAAEEALRDAGLLGPIASADGPALMWPLRADVDPTRVGVLIASSAGGIAEITRQHARLLDGGPRRVRPFLTIAHPANMGGGQVAIRHGLRGNSFTVSSACASATDAIGLALDLIRAGRVDVVLAGGAEAAVNSLIMAAFGAAGALSRRNDDPARASRPFDTDRDGFVIGEGAGVLVLERASHARARGATVRAELAGYGATNDAHHVTRPDPEGAGAVRAIRLALADAGVGPGDVAHVNAHGTSTAANDHAEAKAIRAAFGGHADRVAVTSTKSFVGHLLGAAGAVEAIATVTAMADALVPPTVNVDELDPGCEIDLVTDKPRPLDVDVACSNSFGFGGHNAVLVFRRAG